MLCTINRPMLISARFLTGVGLLCWSCCYGQSLLSLSSASGASGGAVTLNISLNDAYTLRSGGLQWTLNTPADQVVSFTTLAGPAAASAQKSLYCSNQTCILEGINTTPLSSGVVAVVTLTLSTTATGNLLIQLSNPAESLLNGTSGSITATNGMVSVNGVSLAVTPASASLYGGQSVQLAATVAGTTNSEVTWATNPPVGSLSSTGLYTAPPTIATTQSVVVTATSAADNTKSASMNIKLFPPVAVTLNLSTITLQPWQVAQFTANVINTSNSAVTWSLNPVLGAITNGQYSAPHRIRKPQAVTVTATSMTDSTKFATATVTLLPFPLRGHRKASPRN